MTPHACPESKCASLGGGGEQVMAALMSTLQGRLQGEENASLREYLADSLPVSSIPVLAEVTSSAWSCVGCVAGVLSFADELTILCA